MISVESLLMYIGIIAIGLLYYVFSSRRTTDNTPEDDNIEPAPEPLKLDSLVENYSIFSHF